MNNVSKKNSREQLLEAATKLFIDKGYEAVSTRDIAELAEVNLAAIQYHFGSKAKLFVEVVHYMMGSSTCSDSSSLFDFQSSEKPNIRSHIKGDELSTTKTSQTEISKKESINNLIAFIHKFLNHLLCSEKPKACKLMFREIHSDVNTRDPDMYEALVSSVVNNFIKPIDDNLIEILKNINEEYTHHEFQFLANSVVGQCAFYFTHKPFIERLRGIHLEEQNTILQCVQTISRFCLLSLKCDEQTISEVFVNYIKTINSKNL